MVEWLPAIILVVVLTAGLLDDNWPIFASLWRRRNESIGQSPKHRMTKDGLDSYPVARIGTIHLQQAHASGLINKTCYSEAVKKIQEVVDRKGIAVRMTRGSYMRMRGCPECGPCFSGGIPGPPDICPACGHETTRIVGRPIYFSYGTNNNYFVIYERHPQDALRRQLPQEEAEIERADISPWREVLGKTAR